MPKADAVTGLFYVAYLFDHNLTAHDANAERELYFHVPRFGIPLAAAFDHTEACTRQGMARQFNYLTDRAASWRSPAAHSP